MARGELTWSQLRGPRFRRVGPDLYVPSPTAADPVSAALGWAGPGAVLVGWTACRYWAGDVLPRSDLPVELAGLDRRTRPPSGVLVHRGSIDPADILCRGGRRLTAPLRTAYDLARRADLVDAVVAADAVGRAGGFGPAELREYGRRYPGARGCRRTASVASVMDPGAESPIETRTRLVFLAAGVPRPITQYAVIHDGWVVARVDLGWPRERVAVEYDGRDHAVTDRRGRDLDRLDRLEQAGWLVIVVTARQVYRRPDRLVERVRAALRARG